jgi:hypothetical protein
MLEKKLAKDKYLEVLDELRFFLTTQVKQVHEKEVENAKIGNYKYSLEYTNEEKLAIVRNVPNITIPYKDPDALKTKEGKTLQLIYEINKHINVVNTSLDEYFSLEIYEKYCEATRIFPY